MAKTTAKTTTNQDKNQGLQPYAVETKSGKYIVVQATSELAADRRIQDSYNEVAVTIHKVY